jgi:hypothetical protein
MTQIFITKFARASHWSLSVTRIRSTNSIPTSFTSISVLSSNQCLGLSTGLLLLCFPANFLYVFPFYSICAICLTHLILFDLTILMKFPITHFFPDSCYSPLLGPNNSVRYRILEDRHCTYILPLGFKQQGHAVAQLVKPLRYKPEGRVFDSR